MKRELQLTTEAGVKPELASNNRVDSVDVMRGLTILLMAFVNDLADFHPVKGIPQWLRHMASGVDSLTIVDMIIPTFIFIMGISIPLALSRHLQKSGSLKHTMAHVLVRASSLIIMGLFDVNRNGYDTMGWPQGLWKFLAWSFIFSVWMDFPLNSGRKVILHRIVRVLGFAGLVWLAVVFRDENGTFRTGWWGTLGRIGWVYLFASLTWLAVRNNRTMILGLFALVHAFYLGIRNGRFEGNWLIGFLGASVVGTVLACGIAGLLIGTLLIESPGKKRLIQWGLSIGLFSLTASFLLRPLGGLHMPSTSWSFFSTGCASIVWTLLYWSIDIRGWSKGLGYIRIIGRNSLMLYQFSRFWIWLYWLTGLTFYDTLAQNTYTGITRALVYVLFLGAVTVLLSNRKIRLKV